MRKQQLYIFDWFFKSTRILKKRKLESEKVKNKKKPVNYLNPQLGDEVGKHMRLLMIVVMGID